MLCHMNYDLISRLADPAIESKIELVSYLVDRVEKKKTNEEFRDSIVVYLSKREKVPYLGSYCMVGPKYSLGRLVGRFLVYYIEEKDIRKQKGYLVKLLNFLKGFEARKIY